MKKITGINGFGRFGLHLLKYWLDRNNVSNFDIVYINDDFLSLQNALDIIKNDPYVNFKDYEFSLSGNSLVFINKSGEKRSI